MGAMMQAGRSRELGARSQYFNVEWRTTRCADDAKRSSGVRECEWKDYGLEDEAGLS